MHTTTARMIRVFVSMFLLLFSFTLLATTKLLDNFSADSYSTYYINNLTASVNTTQFSEGSSSLQIQYNLSPSGSGEVFRSYGNYPLDLSFQAQALTLKTYGTAGAPALKFMLYEDNDMDGNPFESGEDIYEFISATAFSSGSWTTITMDLNAFSKFGGGTSTLNLNRIYAWRILLENQSGSSINGTVYVDDLQFVTNYSIPSTISNFPNSTFIQLWNDATCGNCGTWSQAEWEQEFEEMKSLCIDEVVIQYGIYNTHSWYSPCTVPGVSSSSNALSNLMAAAQLKNISVYLGLYFDGEFNATNAALSSYYLSLWNKNQVVIDELWNLYGNNSSFKGWYIPQEVHDLYWRSAPEQSLLFNWLDQVCDYAKSKSSMHKTIISPYVGPWMPADYVQSWYESLFTTVDQLNEVWLQDGSGTSSNRSLGNSILKDLDVDAPQYIEAIQAACTAKSRTFAVNVELFSDPAPRNPAAITRIEDQLKIASSFSTQLSSFGWMFLDQDLSTSTQQFYSDYSTLRNCSTTANLTPQVRDASSDSLVAVFDLIGKTHPTNISSLPSGCYILLYASGNAVKCLVE